MSLEIVRTAGSRSYPPRLSTFSQTFWEALAQGDWITTRCRACDKQTFPPKSVCPHCWKCEQAWVPFASTGRLYSWTRVHAAPTAFAPEAPYALGIVDLEDGLRIACRLVAPSSGEVAIGAAIQMIVLQHDDGPLFAGKVLA
ncbi:DNA-binding protein [Variovorax sp. WS11]|uniref:Zn-ribbon domain-containing OB-fold protein n=1 Tax=Variovorax sp. WS11 TaxID=1105204 RepID=UPI000D0D3B71|nr:Zn-ribbon domain-containing OB-fold protein [Variovorax sp. WS11]NDZ18910.1 Zn-ribbon domain-containing OB-fold protein [Variovorax sp. WS11]PSL82423.1 DNA-binding protein [Variovorax sp. WS11]